MRRSLFHRRTFRGRVDADMAGKVMTTLVTCGKFDEVEEMVNDLPTTEEYQTHEEIARAKVALAWHKKDCETVFKLIEEGKFSNPEDLINIWDEAHYFVAEQKLKRRKSLNAVQRYRVRERFPPPDSICPGGGRKKIGIPKSATEALQSWFKEHINHPYPTLVDKLILAREHGLTMCQLKNWFANARRRLRKSRDANSNLRYYQGQCCQERCKPVVDEPSTNQLTRASSAPGEIQDPSGQSNKSADDVRLTPQALWNSACYNNQFLSSFPGGCPQVPSLVADRQYVAFYPNVMAVAHAPILLQTSPLVVLPTHGPHRSFEYDASPCQ